MSTGRSIETVPRRMRLRCAELSDAVGRKELFARHGADVLAAFDEYRRRAGDAAGSEPFRVELRERLGVDLMPRVER